MAKARRLKRIRAAVGEHKRAILGVLLLMIIVSASSLLATQYLMFYMSTLGFERIAVAALVLIAVLLFAVESRMRAAGTVSRIRSKVRGLRKRKSGRRRR